MTLPRDSPSRLRRRPDNLAGDWDR